VQMNNRMTVNRLVKSKMADCGGRRKAQAGTRQSGMGKTVSTAARECHSLSLRLQPRGLVETPSDSITHAQLSQSIRYYYTGVALTIVGDCGAWRTRSQRRCVRELWERMPLEMAQLLCVVRWFLHKLLAVWPSTTPYVEHGADGSALSARSASMGAPVDLRKQPLNHDLHGQLN
jgi:hypothetical protein